MEAQEGPKPTGKHNMIDITGMFVVWRPSETFTVSIVGSENTYIPVFEKVEDLHYAMEAMGNTNYEVKTITDAESFMAGLRAVGDPLLRIMVNLQPGEGRSNYNEIDPNNLIFDHETN